jgi:hypothetical protein
MISFLVLPSVVLVGTVHTALAQTVDSGYARSAIPALSHAAIHYSDGMTRSKTFTLISLATCHFLNGDTDHATTIGTQAVELATTLASARPADRDATTQTPRRQTPRQSPPPVPLDQHVRRGVTAPHATPHAVNRR